MNGIFIRQSIKKKCQSMNGELEVTLWCLFSVSDLKILFLSFIIKGVIFANKYRCLQRYQMPWNWNLGSSDVPNMGTGN